MKIKIIDLESLARSASKDNKNIFFKKIDRLIKRIIGHKLITFTVIDKSKQYVERIYTNNSRVHPLLGTKPVPRNKWSKTIIRDKKNFLHLRNCIKTKDKNHNKKNLSFKKQILPT